MHDLFAGCMPKKNIFVTIYLCYTIATLSSKYLSSCLFFLIVYIKFKDDFFGGCECNQYFKHAIVVVFVVVEA